MFYYEIKQTKPTVAMFENVITRLNFNQTVIINKTGIFICILNDNEFVIYSV